MSKLDTKVREALFNYLKNTNFRDIYYLIFVYEYFPFNENSLYLIELEDSPEKEPSDLNIIYASDYDEGQDIDVLGVYSKYDIYEILRDNFIYTEGE